MEDKNYFDDNSISYSMLRNLSVGPAYFKKIQEEEQEEKEHFIIGGAVDTLLTEPDKFWDKYALEFQEVCEKVPTGQLKVYIDQFWQHGDAGIAYDNAGFKRDTPQKVIEKFEKDGKYYFHWLTKKATYDNDNKNKQILTNSQYNLITTIVENLKTNRFTHKYFDSIDFKNIERFHQLEIYWKSGQNDCKSKLDLVEVNHDLRTIQPLDIKTTGKSTFSFDFSLFSFRYDIKSYLYKINYYLSIVAE